MLTILAFVYDENKQIDGGVQHYPKCLYFV